jgi:antitoxin HicB
MFDYPVTLTQDDGTVLVTFKDVPEAITFGTDESEALMHAVDALETGLSFYIDDKRPLPMPSKPKRGQQTVSPTALECAKLGLYQAMMDQGIRKTDLARRLGWHLPQVDRLFNLKHSSHIKHVETAAIVLGKRLVMSVE